jgi:hypothetical protein
MRDPATYRGNRRKRSKEIVKECNEAGADMSFSQAFQAVQNVFGQRRLWRGHKAQTA